MKSGGLLRYAQALDPLVEARPGASEASIAEIEARLGVRVPDDMRQFLLASNGASLGVRLDSGEVVQDASPLVMSLGEVLETTESLRLHEKVLDVLVFSRAGADGISFGHHYESAETGSVVAWYPSDSRMTSVAPSFAAWLDGWLSGAIKV